jgi:hypothetical protein
VRTPGVRPHDTAAKRPVSRLNSLKQVTTLFLQRLHTHFIGHKRRSAHATTSPSMSVPTRFRCAIPKTSSCEQPTSRLNQSSRRSTCRWRLHSSCPPEDSLIPAGTRHTTFPARFLAQNVCTNTRTSYTNNHAPHAYDSATDPNTSPYSRRPSRTSLERSRTDVFAAPSPGPSRRTRTHARAPSPVTATHTHLRAGLKHQTKLVL